MDRIVDMESMVIKMLFQGYKVSEIVKTLKVDEDVIRKIADKVEMSLNGSD